MTVVERPISTIVPYANNPRKNERAIAGVAESIAQFGFKQPLVVDAQGSIVCGHVRFFAAKRLGMKSVPCVLANDLTSEQLKAYRLLDNKLSELSCWDAELLSEELDSFERDCDFQAFGVNFEEDVFPALERKLERLDVEEDDERDEDASELDARRLDDDSPIARKYKLVVDCESEEEQEDLYERLTLEGFRVRTCCL